MSSSQLSLCSSCQAHAQTDFILLPCDISFPSTLTLASILDKHRATPDAVLTSVWYEAPESVRESEEKMIVAMDKSTEELLLVQPLEALENNDLELRMALISAHPTLSLSTRLLDAHVYVFRRTVLDLLASRRSKDLSSMREQFVPWLLKGAWQYGLSQQWAQSESACKGVPRAIPRSTLIAVLNPPRRDPFAAALARSTATSYRDAQALITPSAPSSAHSDHTPLPGTSEGEALVAFKTAVARGGKSTRNLSSPGWSCRVVVVRPEAPPVDETPKGKGGKGGKAPAGPEPEYIVRANNIAGYWEINRNMVRTLGAANAAAAGREKAPAAVPPAAGEGAEAAAIASSAQISPDSLVGEGVRVGDRASIKKCIVGRHCVIGKNAKLTGCVLWDFVTVEEGARIENAVLCPNVRIGEKAQVKDCEFGPGFEAKPGGESAEQWTLLTHSRAQGRAPRRGPGGLAVCFLSLCILSGHQGRALAGLSN